MKGDNKNDPLAAQKRLFGTLKKIVNKTERYFEIDEEESELSEKNDSKTSHNKKRDPAYKYIKNSSADWKSKLNEEEKEYLNTHPGPFYENQEQFKKRFLSYKKFKDNQ